MSTLKKGQFVSFRIMLGSDTATTVKGHVYKGGKNPEVRFLNQENNTIYSVQLGSGSYTVIDASEVVQIDPIMRDWSLGKVKEAEELSHDTRAFYAEILYKGKRALTIENDGNGGPNLLYALTSKELPLLDQFTKNVQEWYKTHTGEDWMEADAFWFEWESNRKMLGQSAADYLKLEKEEMDKWTREASE